jgi:hemerythrin
MVAYADPDAARHVAEHAKLICELGSYRDTTVFRNRKLAQVLGNWLTSHTQQDDRPLVRHILRSAAHASEPTLERTLLDAFEKVALEVAQSTNQAGRLP